VSGATPVATTTNIDAGASPPTDCGAVMAAKSTKHILAASPPPDDGAMEVLARPAARSTKIIRHPVHQRMTEPWLWELHQLIQGQILLQWPVRLWMVEARPKVQKIFQQ
jgi:hypothetical protein